jgi:hypothetical protein
MASTKFKVEKFDGQNSFSLWHIKMHSLMGQQGLAKILDGKVPSSREECFISHLYYFSTFGSIMYDMECIRPNVSHVVNVVNPSMVF